MTDYKAIADRLVERGILEKCPDQEWYRVVGESPELQQWIDTRQVPHDWRVAGACITDLGKDPYTTVTIQTIDSAAWVEILIYNPGGDEEADPRRIVAHEQEDTLAIILAYLEATDE